MVKKLNKVLIIQARLDSSRFPEKILKKIGVKDSISLQIERLKKSKLVDKIVLAVPDEKINEPLVKIAKKLKINYFLGNKLNVLDRYYKASKEHKADIVIRSTGDCPFIDPYLVDLLIKKILKYKFDYVTNTNPPTFPDGLDVEVFSFKILEQAWIKAKTLEEKEHVTPFLRKSDNIKKYNFEKKIDTSSFRLTLDEPEDLEVLNKTLKGMNKKNFDYKDIDKFIFKNKKVFTLNKSFSRNEGKDMSEGQKIWRRAKRVIPGGVMLFSKNPDLYLPNFWPSYYKKTKGCFIWGIDNQKYTDLSIMGIGTNILGYNRKEIDNKVKAAIVDGNMSTLNSPQEVYLAEKLIQLHPWAKMVRFARSGGEANAIAIRIARAASGKDNIAICGYHGWHDWYLSANLQSPNNLNNHLMSNLEIKGVPKNLKNNVYSFEYNDLSKLKKLVNTKNIGVIKMEVSRNEEPKNSFLQKVRAIANQKNIVLIFDECTSGFRETFGGLHKKYGVNPDMAMFGKALGNGYAITAVIGKKEIMEACQKTFISSTFWTERIGSVAALETLNVMQKTKSWITISKTGLYVKKKWKKLANKYGIPIKIQGIDALPNFVFLSNNHNLFKTYLTQEMLKKNILASNAIYISTSHTKKVLDKYFVVLEDIFNILSKQLYNKNFEKEFLDGPKAITGLRFKNEKKKYI